VNWACATSAWVLLLPLGGCASTVIGEHLEATEAFAAREVGARPALLASPEQRAAAEGRVRALLAAPLTEQGAVQVALEFSPAFQRLLAESVAASAAATQTARLPNPLFAFGQLSAGNAEEIDRALQVSLLDLILLPERRRLADAQQLQHRLRSAGDTVQTATAARLAWIDAVAAQESLQYALRAQQAASAGAELAQRMAAVGNYSRLESARQQEFYADAVAEAARARLEAQRSREALVRLLGLPPPLVSMLTLPGRLPDLPEAADEETILASRALESRLDVALARAELAFTARSLGLTRITSLINAADVAAASSSDSGQETLTGFELEIQLPLFDFGDARRANAQAVYLAALNRTAAVVVEAHSHLRESYAVYRSSFDLARHYRDEVVPLRETIAAETLLRYNGMLVSVFELLADAREQVATIRQAMAARRDFWVADAALRATLIGQPAEGIVLGLPIVAPGAGAAQPH